MIGPDTGEGALRVLRREPLTIVHHVDERGAYATRGRSVLEREGPEGPWRRRARFPAASPLEPLALLRPAARALRLDRCNLHPTRRGGLLGIRAGVVYRIEGESFVPLARIRGDCLMSRAIAETEEGALYFGEYFSNPERRPVRIWRVDPELRRAEVVYAFERPRIRHVHAVHADPYRPGRLWATTGDFEGECFLAFSDDGFRSVSLVGDGSQTFRSVSLIFEPDRIGWLTDSHLVQNRVVTLDRKSGEVSLHGEVASSTWYVARTSDGWLLAGTTVEPGPAVRTHRAFLLCSRDGLDWRTAASFAKDRLPMRFFRFGSLALPSGHYGSDAFWLSGDGLAGLDGRSALCSLAPGEAPA